MITQIDKNLVITVRNVHLLNVFNKQMEKGIIVNLDELIWVSNNFRFWRQKLRFNKKVINSKKLNNILNNNIFSETKFKIKLVKRTKPFYFGDYIYFCNHQDSLREDGKIENNIYYIDVLEKI